MKDQNELTVREAAAVLGVALETVRRLTYNGRFPARRVGRELMIPANAVQAYRAERQERLRSQLARLQEAAV